MRTAPTRVWPAIWLLAVTGCGPVPEDATEPAVGNVTDTGRVGIGAPGDSVSSTASHPPPPPAEADPSPFPDLDTEKVVRIYDLWIVNRARVDLFVYASAGAGRVPLDTVPGRDSVRVNVRVRARSLSLEAEDENGRALGSTTLELAPAASNRWEIVDPGGAP